MCELYRLHGWGLKGKQNQFASTFKFKINYILALIMFIATNFVFSIFLTSQSDNSHLGWFMMAADYY